MFQLIETKLEVMSKNILYLTYRLDMHIKTTNASMLDKSLQKQVDDYFEDDAEDKAEHIPDGKNEQD